MDKSDIAPVRSESRIKSLDAMRGFAVLGILIVNAAFFAAPWQTSQNPLLPPLAVTDETLWSWFVMHTFFEYKCITLFSLLFGASIYLVGGERDDAARGAVLRRRLGWLLVFGLIHGVLIWYGDILLTYALTGFLVMLARSWPPRVLLLNGVVFYVLSVAASSLLGLTYESIPAETLATVEAQVHAPPPEAIAAEIAAYRGGFVSALMQNAETWTQFVFSGLPSLMVRTTGLMMIGMALFKMGFLSGKAPAWVYSVVCAVGAVAITLIGCQASLNWQAGYDFRHMVTRGHFANAALSIFGSLGCAALFVLLVKAGARFVTEPLAAVGRMAFTNYIAQSLIMTTIFWSGRGFGLYGEVDRPSLMGIVAAIWALQLVWSPLWLSRFEMGPLEWVWRRLSYGRPVRIAKSAPA